MWTSWLAWLINDRFAHVAVHAYRRMSFIFACVCVLNKRQLQLHSPVCEQCSCSVSYCMNMSFGVAF